MKKLLKQPLFVLALFFVLVGLMPVSAFAHQPRITENRLTQVLDPEISKAYYAQLQGEPDVYIIDTDKPFDLYVNILVPDITDQKKDLSVVVIKDGNTETPFVLLDGLNFEWKKFYEPFGADTYWMGPEYKVRAEAGRYEIRVWSSNNDSKYSLAVGEIEAFDLKETVNAVTLIPELKKDFFNVSPIGFIVSPFGFGLIIILYILAALVGFLYRFILKSFNKGVVRGVSKNIGIYDRLFRLCVGLGLLLWALLTTWSPIVIFFSGFAIFESIFSWCGFYAAIGRNTCPVE